MKTIVLLLVTLLSTPAMLFGQDAVKSADKAADAAKEGVDKMSEAELPKAIVRGRVFYEETGQPLRRTWIGFVKIREIDPVVPSNSANEDAKDVSNAWEYTNPEAVLTNDFGEFVMKNVEPGIYQAVLRLPGILNPTISDNESTLFQQFTFESASESQIEVGVKKGGAVSGYVRYPDGAPLIAAEVNLRKVKQKETGEIETELVEELGTVYTDDRGYYRFAGLPEGEYIVDTSEPSVFDGSDAKVSSYSTTRYYSTSELKTYFPQSKTLLGASRLQVYRGEELTDIDIILAPRQLYEVSGRVVGAKDNKLIDGIEIEFEKAGETSESDYQAQIIRTTTSDSEGRWRFKDLVPGKYVAKISEPSFRRYRDENEDPPFRSNYASSEHEFEVTEGENRDVIFRLAVESSISGIVTVEGNQPLPDNVNVFADTKLGRASSGTVETIDYDSEEAVQRVRSGFTLDDLKAGEYYLTVKASEGYIARSITYKGKEVLDVPLVIKESEALNDVRVVLSKGSGTVKGKVVGNESPYVYVMLMPIRESVSLYRSYLQADSDYVADENTYEVSVKPGQYYLFIKVDYDDEPKKNSSPEESEAWVRDKIKNARVITIQRGQTLEVDLDMPE